MSGKLSASSWSVFLADGYDLLAGKVKNVTAKIENVLEDTTGLGDAWERFNPTGVRKSMFTQAGAFFDDTASGIHALLNASQMVSRVVCAGYGGNAIGAKAFGAEGMYAMSYEVLGEVGKLTKANVGYTVSGQADHGLVLQHQVAKTADWNTKSLGTQVDSGASSATGGVGYLQVSALSGFSGVVVKIRHSSDDSTYVDLITFTTVTGVTASGRP